MVNSKLLATVVIVAAVMAVSFSIGQVSAQDNMTSGNMTEGENMTSMDTNMTDGSGNVSGLAGGFGE